MNNNSHDQNCSHVIQKTGLLKNFSIVKTITVRELEKMKEDARKQTTTEVGYKELLSNKLTEIRNMHDSKNPIPGIIYKAPPDPRKAELMDLASDIIEDLKKDKLTHTDFTYLVLSMISKLKLTTEDFQGISNEGNVEDGETDDDDGDEDDDGEFAEEDEEGEEDYEV